MLMNDSDMDVLFCDKKKKECNLYILNIIILISDIEYKTRTLIYFRVFLASLSSLSHYNFIFIVLFIYMFVIVFPLRNAVRWKPKKLTFL